MLNWALRTWPKRQFVGSLVNGFSSLSKFSRYKEIKHVHKLVSNKRNHKFPTGLITRCGLFTVASTTFLFTTNVAREIQSKNNRSILEEESLLSKLSKFIDQHSTNANKHFKDTIVYPAIAVINLFVYIGLNSPFSNSLKPYFSNGLCGPIPVFSMLTSVFAHQNFVHLFLNMYVLHSFAQNLIPAIGSGEFVCLFMSGGIFASFMSLLFKSIRNSSVLSIGASGGICAVIAASCMLYPNDRLCVPFLVNIVPHSFKAESAIRFMLIFELVGAIFFRRSPLDHAAHMGGLLFGMLYAKDGMKGIKERQKRIANRIKNIVRAN